MDRTGSIAGTLLLLMAAGCGGPAGRLAKQLDARAPLTGADAYFRQTLRMLDAAEANLPEIVTSATAAAKLYVHGDSTCKDYGLASDGEVAFLSEGLGRSGCVMGHGNSRPRGGRRRWKGVVLYCLRPDDLADDLRRIAEYNRAGSKVFLFGAAGLLAKATRSGAKCVATVTIPCAPHDGLFPAPGGRWLVPTYQVGAMATLLPWVGEFVAACTREGKMPPMWQSYRKPTGRGRYQRLKDTKFHEKAPPPVAPGQLGKAWLDAVRRHLAAMYDSQIDRIRRGAAMALAARRGGGKLYVVSAGHGATFLYDRPHEPGTFTHVSRMWRRQNRRSKRARKKLTLTDKDLVIGVGYDTVFNDKGYHRFADFLRKGGAGAVWLAATYKPQWVRTAPGELLIDTQWGYGDAVVDLPGYDVKILPASGILTATAYFMVVSEMLAETREP